MYKILEAFGYPREGTDWLRRQRLLVVLVLAILSWIILLLLGSFVLGLVQQIIAFVR